MHIFCLYYLYGIFKFIVSISILLTIYQLFIMGKLLKTSLSIAILTVALISCENKSQEEPIYNQAIETGRSVDWAIATATSFADQLFAPTSRAECRRVSSKSQVIVYLSQTSRSTKADTLYYVVNFDNESGFAIIPKKSNADPCLVVTESGSYEPNIKTGVDGFDDYMEALNFILPDTSLIKEPEPINPPPFIAMQYDTLSNIKVGPNFDYRWGSYYPECLYCPNGIAGCGPVSALFVLAFLQKPQTLAINYPGCTTDNLNIYWNAILHHTQSFDSLDDYYNHIPNCDISNNAHIQLATICRQLGELLDANYLETETSIYHGDLTSVFRNLGLSSHISNWYSWSDENAIKEILASRNIILVRGALKGQSGHLWMCDGYQNLVLKLPPRAIGFDDSVDDEIVEKEFFHFNWGWNGKCNGYFSSSIMNPQKADSYDTSQHTIRSYPFYNIVCMNIKK